jgi:ribonuclease HIII
MNFVLTVNDNDAKRIETFYQDYTSNVPNEHVRFFAKTDLVTVTLYHSGKLVFQGSEAQGEYDMWSAMLQIEPPPKTANEPISFNDYYYPSIGSDEVGTGDVFGPVVVCAAYLSKESISLVKGLGIKDSKQLHDDRIRVLGEQLINHVQYSVLTLHNEKYNELVRQGFNLNKMKAYLHNKAILNVLKKINGTPEVIQDQFAEEHLYYRYLMNEQQVYKNITFLTKAESKYASVAVASIIARYAFLQHFDLLSKQSGYTLLKGAGPKVDELLATIIDQKGEGYLSTFTKMNFKNITKAKQLLI